jgi:E3 ubiquitin-protein ligase MARCH6
VALQDLFAHTHFFLAVLINNSRPLFKPCKCSGSIGLTHQDCLQSWLAVQRGSGACELCKTPFRFSPQYAESAPDHLPKLDVLVGLGRRLVARWLPFIMRIMFAASLWLIVAPLVTAYLYLGWMNRPSVILQRFSWTLITTDLVSGAVVAAYIIISFLSLMSFADFLRVEWQQRGLGPLVRHPRRGEVAAQMPPAPREEDIDDGVWRFVQQEILAQPRGLARHDFAGGVESELPASYRRAASSDAENNDDNDDESSNAGSEDLVLDMDNEENVPGSSDDEDEAFEPDFEPDEELEVDTDIESENEEENEQVGPPGLPLLDLGAQQQNRDDARQDRPFDFDQDDAMDVDINIALDELLGVRGPLGGVVRNLMWLLAFNAVYVGFFCFVPRTVGTAVSSILFNSTQIGQDGTNVTEAYQDLARTFSLAAVVNAVDAESARHQTVFRLRDLVTVTLGYLACGAAAWVGRLLWLMSQRIGFFAGQGRRTGLVEFDEMREVMDEMNRLVNGHMNDVAQPGDEPPGVALNMAVGVALEAMMAIVKVGVLLFLKMFLLPILLGLCLDASVVSVFGFEIKILIVNAGKDLFSFVLLHWVCGITFMLLVTVSVLQLREVVHPDLLAQIIRPQEPQPDLLGNLMHEKIGTHAKRMALSLVIYAVLWVMHVYFPAHLVAASGIIKYLPTMEIKLCYLIPSALQVPIELLFFHLCMLGMLERYKNGLGEMEHHWLKLLTGIMGLQHCVLPLKVVSFRYVGSRAVFERERVVNPFWYDLAKGGSSREQLIDAQCKEFRKLLAVSVIEGVTKENGQRLLSVGCDYIRLPYILPGRALRSRRTLLPTNIGKYRLSRGGHGGDENVIHLWREEAGAPIPRPPEGWDDLGVEPPDVQGRWAYGHEKKSAIEWGVARRQSFFSSDQRLIESVPVFLKLSVLFFLSWVATTLLLFSVVVIPPVAGRLLYFILRVPDKWIHDPLAFALGFVLTIPAVAVGARAVVASNQYSLWRRIALWILRFRFPSFHKGGVLFQTAILWFGLAPLLLGATYDMAVVKSSEWFLGNEPFVDRKSVLMDWITGALLLYVWSFLCIRGVLTRRFRFILEGRDLPEEDNLADAQAAARRNAGDGQMRLTWQGQHGRIARFWGVWNDAFLRWEWERVDSVTLLHDVAVPVTTELFFAFIFPAAFVICCDWTLPSISGPSRATLVRLLIATIGCTRVARSWRDQLSAWFEIAHKSARDDYYLIGEVLMNYGE